MIAHLRVATALIKTHIRDDVFRHTIPAQRGKCPRFARIDTTANNQVYQTVFVSFSLVKFLVLQGRAGIDSKTDPDLLTHVGLSRHIGTRNLNRVRIDDHGLVADPFGLRKTHKGDQNECDD